MGVSSKSEQVTCELFGERVDMARMTQHQLDMMNWVSWSACHADI